MKIIIAVVAFFVFVTMLGIGACVYIGYRAKRAVEQVKQGETSIQIPTGEGSIKLGGHPTEEGGTVAGVPVYPGATALEGGAQLSFGDKLQIGGQDYETSDSVDQVVSFYKEKLGDQLSVAENDGHYRLSVETHDANRAGVVTIDVVADEGSGKTKITVSHLGGMK